MVQQNETGLTFGTQCAVHVRIKSNAAFAVGDITETVIYGICAIRLQQTSVSNPSLHADREVQVHEETGVALAFTTGAVAAGDSIAAVTVN